MPEPTEPTAVSAASGSQIFTSVLTVLTEGLPVAPTLLNSPSDPRPPELITSWQATTLDQVNMPLESGESHPLIILPAWDRPRGRGLAAHHKEILAAPGWADPLFVLLPAGDMDSTHAAEFRTLVLREWHLVCAVFLRDTLLGLHASVDAALLVLRRNSDHHRAVRFFDAADDSDNIEWDSLMDELRRILRMKGGTTAHGYVLQSTPQDLRLGFRRNDPRLHARRTALAAYGTTVRIDEIFDALPQFYPPHSKDSRASGDGAGKTTRVLTGRDVQLGRIADADSDAMASVPRSHWLRVGDIVLRSLSSSNRQQGLKLR